VLGTQCSKTRGHGAAFVARRAVVNGEDREEAAIVDDNAVEVGPHEGGKLVTRKPWIPCRSMLLLRTTVSTPNCSVLIASSLLSQ